jgi:hypothetical protein
VSELNPRYELYLKINPSPKSWQYINWIAKMSSKYRNTIGVDKHYGVSRDLGFDSFLEDEVQQATGQKIEKVTND